MKSRTVPSIAMLLLSLVLSGCSAISFVPGAPETSSPVPGTLVYDAPVSLNIKNGGTLTGTQIGYGGKTTTGAAKMLLAGVVATKQMGDSVDWQGTPAPNANLRLATRVVIFDEQSVTLVGSAHLEIKNVTVQPGGTATSAGLDLSAPVTYSIAKGATIPGTKVAYVGSSNQGAQFSGIEGFPYRKELDSLEYVGHLNPKVLLQLSLRVLSYSETSTLLGGTAKLKIEP